ncbi:hypothetical protein [Burkholderia contaminans]|uniref:Uncharacterized protein n=1 Tax=Burkholderia contaminans TaxID=488447 RepID=A0A3N8RUE6_9BURK|nr:hypothetical protein [Burkholderia contaminans]RQT22103.1 hypothetical protein DF037_28770 [Burkholderia contaminans]
MLAVLVLSTWVLMAPIASLDALRFWNSAEPLFIATFVTALVFLPAVHLTCTQRGSWSALRRAQRGLRHFGMGVALLCMLVMILIVWNLDSPPSAPRAAIAETAFDLCFDGMVAGATLALWSLLVLPVLHGLVRAELAWKQRGAR